MRFNLGRTRIELVEGDIALQDTDAVVTAAHWDLQGGQGTDGSIHGKGGPEILDECREIGGCPIGGAVVTGAGRLQARHVIHAVGPVYETGDDYEQDLLASAYDESLRRAAELGLRSLSIPSLSTGAFNYPLRLAAPVAARAVVRYLREEEHPLETVRMVLYPEEQPQALSLYAAAFEEALRERNASDEAGGLNALP